MTGLFIGLAILAAIGFGLMFWMWPKPRPGEEQRGGPFKPGSGPF